MQSYIFPALFLTFPACAFHFDLQNFFHFCTQLLLFIFLLPAPLKCFIIELTRGGGHGDYHTLVLAPASVQENADMMAEAFDLAEKYRHPVLIASDAAIGQMIEAAILSPSWKNSQTARYHVVSSPEMLKKIKTDCLPDFNQKNCQDAPVLIICTFVKNRAGFERDGQPSNEVGQGWGFYDCGLHNETLILKAKDLGLDTLVMGIRDSEKIREALNIPENEEIVSVISVGYRAVDPEMPKRKSMADITKFY